MIIKLLTNVLLADLVCPLIPLLILKDLEAHIIVQTHADFIGLYVRIECEEYDTYLIS